MKKIITQSFVFCLSLCMSWGTALSFTHGFPSGSEDSPVLMDAGNEFPIPPAHKSFPASSIHIESSRKGVTLQVKNSALADVLQKVANHTNIMFNARDQLISHRITVNIQGPTWNAVIETLLKDFSRITVGNEKSGGMKEVRLLGRNNWDPQEAFETASFDNQPMEAQSQGPGLSITKLKRLINIPPGNAIPANLFSDQEIRQFLELKGIKSPEEWRYPKKSRTALQMAKRELTRLLFEKQKKL